MIKGLSFGVSNARKSCNVASDFSEVTWYKDIRKQKKFGRYKAEFVIADGETKDLDFSVEVSKVARCWIDAEICRDFDKEKPSVYTQKVNSGSI